MNFLSVLKKEYYIWIPFAVLCFFVGSVALSGFPQGLFPNIKYPFGYGGDLFSMADVVGKVMEGSVYENARHAFPFGSYNYDYPIPEVGILFIVKLLSFIFGSPFTILNILLLITFPLCFISAYGVLRAFGLNGALSVSAAVLYVFIPFHFFRIAHLFYTFYFVVPLYFYYGYIIASKVFLEKLSGWKNNKLFFLGHILALAALASIGVYYAFFGMLTIFICGFLGSFYNKTWRSAAAAFVACFILLVSVAAYTSPVLYYQHTNGKNEEVAARQFIESEIYGLKMIQLLLPSPQHRMEALGNKTRDYNGHAPLITENWTATLGFIGSVGFVSVLIYIFIIVSGGGRRFFSEKLSLLSASVLFQLLYATIGGIGALVAFLVYPMIRGLNRISIFIAFGCLAVFFIILDAILKKYVPSGKFLKPAMVSAALVLGVFGFWDQIGAVPKTSLDPSYLSDKKFVEAIEASLPKGAGIYQTPYSVYPEVPAIYNMPEYALMIGFLHSKDLRWSYGGMKGRKPDKFFQKLEAEPVEERLKTIRKLGFQGIYVDNRGFADAGREINEKLRVLLRKGPDLTSDNGNLVFYKLDGFDNPTKEEIRAITEKYPAGE